MVLIVHQVRSLEVDALTGRVVASSTCTAVVFERLPAPSTAPRAPTLRA